jgi:phosphoglycolate phosphatase
MSPHAAHRPPPIRAVAIDLDGTLLDTVGEIAAAINMLLERLASTEATPHAHPGIARLLSTRSLPENAVRNMIGKGMANLVRHALVAATGHQPSAEMAAHALGVYQECYYEILGTTTIPYDGVIAGLDCLHGLGLKLACITNKSTRFTLPLLERTDLVHRFEHVVCGDTYERRKPDPMPLLKTAERFGCAPSELLMIGDSINDVLAARAAGSPVLCVPYGYNEGEPVDKLDYDGMIADLSEACAWIVERSAANAPSK